MSLSIHKKDLSQFLNSVIAEHPTYGPTESESNKSGVRFGRLKSAKDFQLGYGITMIPPKKYLFPAKEDVFRFERGEILPPTNKDFAVFGVSKKDGEGLFYLDKIYEYPIVDTFYTERRKHMKLVIIDALPPSNNINCDLYLQNVDESHLLAFPFTEFGEKLVTGNPLFGQEKESGSISVRHMPDNIIYHPKLAEIIENSRNHAVWKSLAKTCFNCGICSYTCPLCYCYEETDRIDIRGDVAKDVPGGRERRWDSCMLPDFAAVSFKNFRPETEDRIYNWYHHKFVRMPQEYGFVGCIDCGRCITYCPARINYRKVLEKLIEDYPKTKAKVSK